MGDYKLEVHCKRRHHCVDLPSGDNSYLIKYFAIVKIEESMFKFKLCKLWYQDDAYPISEWEYKRDREGVWRSIHNDIYDGMQKEYSPGTLEATAFELLLEKMG